MTVRLKLALYGALRDRMGSFAVPGWEVEQGLTLRGALRRLESERGPLGEGVAVAVNGFMIRGDQELFDGDEITLLPPVSGG